MAKAILFQQKDILPVLPSHHHILAVNLAREQSHALVTGRRAGHRDKLKTTKIAGAQQFRLDFPSAIRGISTQPFVRTVIMRELDEPKILQRSVEQTSNLSSLMRTSTA